MTKFTLAGPASLRRRRSRADDPAHGGAAAIKRAASNRHRAANRKAWETAHTPAQADQARSPFTIEILPALAPLTITRISRETGLSLRYASLIRSGQCTPHPCLYPAFDQLLTERFAEPAADQADRKPPIDTELCLDITRSA
ncbi:MAG: hypothetical protein KAT23_03020 [Anaerolineales bacterium]|nr:hypothetical protein [Anaerolineales bacterium]